MIEYDMDETCGEHTDQIGLKKENAIDRARWCDGVYKLLRNTR